MQAADVPSSAQPELHQHWVKATQSVNLPALRFDFAGHDASVAKGLLGVIESADSAALADASPLTSP
jgi:hypothetical protein